MILTWDKFKAFFDARNPVMLSVEHASYYHLYINDNGLILTCDIDKNPSDETDLTDFETNYLPLCNPELIRDELYRETTALAAVPYKDNLRLRYTGIAFSVTAGSSGAYEYKLPEDRKINGSQLFLQNHVFGDYVLFKAVDKDNILGLGENYLIDTFADNFWVDPNRCAQDHYVCNYSAFLLKDLYIVLEYYSTGGSNVDVKCILQLHKVT